MPAIRVPIPVRPRVLGIDRIPVPTIARIRGAQVPIVATSLTADISPIVAINPIAGTNLIVDISPTVPVVLMPTPAGRVARPSVRTRVRVEVPPDRVRHTGVPVVRLPVW